MVALAAGLLLSTDVDKAGMSTYVDDMVSQTPLTDAAGSGDPAVGLAAVRALRELAERLEAVQVQNARAQGWSWQDIAGYIGVSRQAVHKKYSQRPVLFGKGR